MDKQKIANKQWVEIANNYHPEGTTMSTQSILAEFNKNFGNNVYMKMDSENDELVGKDEDGNYIYKPMYENIVDDINSFLAKAIEEVVKEEKERIRQEVIKYQNGFVKDMGDGDYCLAPEHEVIENLLVELWEDNL